MEDIQRVPCPYCRELILPGAIKCKECGSNLRGANSVSRKMVWSRNWPDRKLLGVSACIAHNLRVSPTLVRLVFVLLTFLSLLGVFLYLGLAAVIPYAHGGRSAFEAVVDAIGAAFDNFRSHPVAAPVGVGGVSANEAVFESPSAASTAVPPVPPPTSVNPPADSTGTQNTVQ